MPRPGTRLLILVVGLSLLAAPGCRRRHLAVPEPTYRETVSAFYTGLAAMQTSQELLAREKFQRVTALVPDEPAGWANLGLLLMRLQQLDEAVEKLDKAAALAPKSAPIERLLALAESRRGNLDAAIAHLRRALDLDPGDLKAAFLLAQETERQGAEGSAVQTQRLLEALLLRSGNLAARLDLARVSAKRGDAPALQNTIDRLAEASKAWPEEVQPYWHALRDAAGGDARQDATRVAFLKNVLVRTPEYRRALAAISTPSDEIGEPFSRFLALEQPTSEAAPADVALTFVVAPAPGVNAEGASFAGVAWLDGEGAPALVAADARGLHIGESVAGVAGGAFSTPGAWAGVLAADLDYDFRTDFVLTGAGGVALLRQREDGSLHDVTAEAKLPSSASQGAATGAWAADIDTDGDLDIVVGATQGAPIVLRNNGDGSFATRSPFSGSARLRDFVWADFDGEGVPDAALLDADGTLRLFLNQRGGAFSEQPLPALAKAVALAVADVNGDGRFDLLALTAQGSVVRSSPGEDGRTWQVAQVASLDAPLSGLAPGAGRLLVADLDNNGALDLVVAGKSASQLFLGGSEGVFKAQGRALALSVRAAADLDGDGRLELVGLDAEGRVVQAKSRGAMAYHWQTLRPRAASTTGDQRINSFGVGGEIEIRNGLAAQKQVITTPVVHFGMGASARADVVRVAWPNGTLQSEFDSAADRVVLTEQRLKGSCPWLFAWNGREMGFVTDLIWRSPLGLRINAQATADVLMTEDWVKLRGDQLAPRDGEYDLRITAELWETHFFDLVSLLVVDHPQGTELFVDERFAVPPPRLQPVATGPVQEFAEARDDRGADVAAVVSARDGEHLDSAGRGAYQGVTRQHFVELELPEAAPRRGTLYLVGQGWIHPTDSSVNVALGQGSRPQPQGLALSVADASGRFHEVRQGLGFPAGKDKTILIDLAGLFPAKAKRRLRLSSNLEIYWDRLGWAVGRPDLKLEPRRVLLRSAELRPRGYSVTEQASASSPERPRYVLAGTAPRWRDLEGYHTRFGDVKDLLRAVDDRYVILNAGDELRFRFAAVEAAAPGQQRDFIVIGDGWVKDGDYNTAFSRTVLPLPTHATGRYDRPPTRLEDDPVYQQHAADFAEYHTRYVSPERVRDALHVPGGEKP